MKYVNRDFFSFPILQKEYIDLIPAETGDDHYDQITVRDLTCIVANSSVGGDQFQEIHILFWPMLLINEQS